VVRNFVIRKVIPELRKLLGGKVTDINQMNFMGKIMTGWDLINTIVLSILLGWQWTIGMEGLVIGVIIFFIILIGYIIRNK
jgi:hypothetical protein